MQHNWTYKLWAGHSDDPSQGACAMDAVNWLVHGRHGDAPECACPVIAKFVIPANDAMDDETRQRFIPYLHRIAGSRSPEHEAARLRIAVLAATRIFAARAMEYAGLPSVAARLRTLPDDASFPAIRQAAEAAAAGAARAAWAARAAEAAAARAAWAAEAARAAAEGAEAARAAAEGAKAAEAGAVVWDDYFAVLDAMLRAGPEGEPWSADAIDNGERLYREAGGLAAVA